jgi:hypothetical protein
MLLIDLAPGEDIRRERLCFKISEGLHDADFVHKAETIL